MRYAIERKNKAQVQADMILEILTELVVAALQALIKALSLAEKPGIWYISPNILNFPGKT